MGSFMKRAARPSVTKLSGPAAKDFASIDDVVLVAYLNPQDDHLLKDLNKVAATYSDRASFGALKTKDPTTVACYNNRDMMQSSSTNFEAVGSLTKFVNACMTPLIDEFTRATETKYLQVRPSHPYIPSPLFFSLIPSHPSTQSGKSIVYYLSANPSERAAYVEALRPVARKFGEYLTFLTVDAAEYAELGGFLGLGRVPVLPALAVQNPRMGQVFPYTGEGEGEGAGGITPQAVDDFVMAIVQGRVKPWAPPPPPQADHVRDEL